MHRPVTPPAIGTTVQRIGAHRKIQVCHGTRSGDLPETGFPFNILFVEHHEAFPLHRHQYSELVIVLGGRARHITDHETYDIERGDIFVLNGTMQHGFEDAQDLMLCNVQYDPSHLLPSRGDLNEMMGYHALFDLEPRACQAQQFRRRLHLADHDLAYAESLARAMEQEFFGRAEGRRTSIRATFLLLATHLCRLYAEQKKDSPAPVVRMASVIAHIQKHFREPLRIDLLARIAHLSPSQFQRTFKRMHGDTPIGFVNRLRIEEAKKLLRDPNRDIASIAHDTGFSTPAFFSTQFRKSTGQSPSAYRRNAFAETRKAS